ncbi:hypothetical protein FAM22020_001958 [Propionibacterium freudenreichii]|uniref:hypothetical protein n=1 Tax=Propionibacterium freudenreichii TaxID=1744 RepID=UPI00254A4C59|nr:hypothetical protein [Propionibacterium freudenreichii]MDK9354267.1 hypothetical protein [Propionibacterium freudenreichii]MDK9621895.1 hypothetical protein [Propionibacterium freudenreichii]
MAAPESWTWTPRGVPGLRRRFVRDSRHLDERLERLAAAHPDVVAEAMGDKALPMVGFGWTAERLGNASLFWVSGEMAALAMDAALDVPEWSPGQLITPTGLACFATPLPGPAPRTFDLPGGRTWQGNPPVWAIAWLPAPGGGTMIQLLGRLADCPPGFADVDGPLVEILSILIRPESDLDASLSPEARMSASLLMAMSVLMDTPTVAERHTIDSRTGKAPGTEHRPRTQHPDRHVTLVDLRPVRTVVTDHDEGTGHKLTVRFMVRGHWTHQVHGPKRGLRKLIFIAPYLKGPEGAPLRATEKVMVWRR